MDSLEVCGLLDSIPTTETSEKSVVTKQNASRNPKASTTTTHDDVCRNGHDLKIYRKSYGRYKSFCSECRRAADRANRLSKNLLIYQQNPVQDDETPEVPGADFALISGNGGLGNYTFHRPADESPEAIIRKGGLNADELIDEWFDYEYNNRRACAEYDEVERKADKHFEDWNQKWNKKD